MNKVKLYRVWSGKTHTFGRLVLPGSFSCWTLELPWLNNQKSISCIPAGEYLCSLYQSPRFGSVYQVLDVVGRTYILFHAGNTTQDTHGCILLGRKAGFIAGSRAVLLSRPTVRAFNQLHQGQDFYLQVIGGQHAS